MTVDDIKQQFSMRDVCRMYGFRPNRAGFIFCPMHNEKGHASMRIYEKDYHCFGCGANGDVFTFIQEIDHCDFKTAFLKLGGTYEKKTDWQQKKFQYELQQRKEREQREQREKKQLKKTILKDISTQQLFVKLSTPLSDDWCDAMNRLEYDFYVLEELQKEGVNIYD